MRTSTRVALPFFYALVEAYNNENYPEGNIKMEHNHSEYSHDTNQDLVIPPLNIAAEDKFTLG